MKKLYWIPNTALNICVFVITWWYFYISHDVKTDLSTKDRETFYSLAALEHVRAGSSNI